MQFLTNLDLSKNELQNAVIQNLSAAPSNPRVGQIYYNTTDQMTYQWKRTSADGVTPETFAWKAIGGVVAGDGLTNTDDTLSVTPGNGIELSGTSPNKAVAVKAYDGIAVSSNGVAVDVGNGLQLTGTSPNKKVAAKGYNGISVDSNGINADIDTTAGMIFTGNTAGSKKIGINTDSTLEFSNGALKVKVPTDNNFTTGLKEKLEDIEAGAEVNTIETVKVNGTALTPDANRAIDVPTIHTATFTDDSTNTAASPVKLTLTEGTNNDTITANIPKVSSTSAGVAPKGAAVTTQSQTTKFLREDGTWAAPSYTQDSGGTVTSIGIQNATNGGISVSGSPITTSGTITIGLANNYGDTKNPYAAKSPHYILAGPSSGSSSATPSFRALVAADIPDLSGTYLAKSGGTMSGAINMGSNKITSLGTPTADADAATKKYVDDAITNLPEPMIFKGTLGTGGTITSLPTAAVSNEGWTYKVITAGTYNSQSAKVGDLFICRNVSGSLYEWTYVPSGDEPSGTVTNVATGAELTGGPITSTGTIAHATSGVTAGTYPKVTVNQYGHVTAGSSLGTSDIPNLSGTYVTLTGNQTILGDKTFQSNIIMDTQPIILRHGEDGYYYPNVLIKNEQSNLRVYNYDGSIATDIIIRGVAEPQDNNDAVNREYVDPFLVGSATFADDTTNNASNPVKLTLINAKLWDAEQEAAVEVANANIPKVSSSSAGVLPKFVSGAQSSTKITATDYLWDATQGDYRQLPLGDYVKKDGTVAMTGALNMNSHKVTNVTDPTSAQDAATKNYVDSAISEVTGGSVKKRVANNPALTASGGVFTWTIAAGTGSSQAPQTPDVSVMVYENGTPNKQVIPEIEVASTGAVTIKINDTNDVGTLAASTYRAVMIA